MKIIYLSTITALNAVGLMITNDIQIAGTLAIILITSIGLIFIDSLDTLKQYNTMKASEKVYKLGVITTYIIQSIVFLYMVYRVLEVYY
jgi:hypothetical protein